MTDYNELAEDLKQGVGYWYRKDPARLVAMFADAAAAIEDLEGFLAEAERDRDEYEERMRKEQERVIELQAEADALAHDIGRYVGINAELTTETEALQAQLPKRGEWITIRLNNGGSYTGCSCCEAPIPTDTMLDYIPEIESKYCYSCGAMMEVQE